MAPIGWTVRAGSTVDGELTIVDEDGNLTPVDVVTWDLYDRTGALVTSGGGEYESDGIYLIRPTIPSNATTGHTYGILVTVTPVSGGSVTETLLIPILVGGPTL